MSLSDSIESEKRYSRKSLWIAWTLLSLISIGIFVPFLAPSDDGVFSTTLDAINILASVFIIGLPFSVCPLLILEKTKWNIKKEGIRLYGLVFLLCSSLFLLVGFFITVIYNLPIEHRIGILLAGMIVSIAPSIITTVIVQYIREWRYSILLCSSVFLFVSYNFGYLPNHVQMGASSLYSLYHLYRFLAVSMAGYQFENISQMENALGIGIDSIQIVIPLVIWTLLALFLFLTSRIRIMRKLQEPEELVSSELVPHVPSLGTKKQVVGTTLAILLILSGASYVWNITSPANNYETYILYSSSITGDTLVLGDWLAIEVEFPDNLNNVDVTWNFKIEVLDWGTVQEPMLIAIQFGFEDISFSQFAGMNETEKDTLFSGQLTGLSNNQPSVSTGWTFINYRGTALWAHRMTNQGVNQDGAEFTANIVISIRAE